MNWKEPFFAGKIYWCWHKRCHSILTTSNLQCWLVHCVNQMRGCIDWSLSSPYHRCRLWISENWLLAPVPSSGNYWCHVGPCYPLYYGGHNVSPCLPPPSHRGWGRAGEAQAVVRQQQPPPPSPLAGAASTPNVCPSSVLHPTPPHKHRWYNGDIVSLCLSSFT